ncbi:MAG: 2-dehydropantoate 2-reductase [Nitrospinales bacterium]|jgi:2-dehydropantoate 2-reductase
MSPVLRFYMIESPNMLKVLVVGAGAVGLGLASFLLQSGCRVSLLGREDTELVKNGLYRIGIFGEFHSNSFEIFNGNAKEVKFDFVLVCVKSFDTENTGRQLQEFLSGASKIVLCQNGWGNAEIFSRYFKNVFNARVITGFIRPQKNKVDVTVHAQPVHFGSLFGGDLECLEPLANALRGGGLPSAVTPYIAKDLWAKMLYNCPLNALGALLEVPYGLLGEKESTREIMDGIVDEVFAVMRAMGYETHWKNAQYYLEEFYGELLPSTYEHESSMLQDLRAGKVTEIEAINGVVVKEAEKKNIAVPYNILVSNLVRFLQEKRKN